MSADAIHGHHRQRRTTARRLAVPAIGHMSRLIGRVRREAAPVPAFSMAVIDSTGVSSFIDLLM